MLVPVPMDAVVDGVIVIPCVVTVPFAVEVVRPL